MTADERSPAADCGASINEWVKVVRRAKLHKTAKLIAFLMVSYADADGTNIYPGFARLAVQAGVSYATVKRETARLCAIGLIDRMPRSGTRRGWSACYRLILSPDLLEKVDVPTPAAENAAVEAVVERERAYLRKYRAKHRKTKHLPVDNPLQPTTMKGHPDDLSSGDERSSGRPSGKVTPNSLTSGDDPTTLPVPLPGLNPPSDETDLRNGGTGDGAQARATKTTSRQSGADTRTRSPPGCATLEASGDRPPDRQPRDEGTPGRHLPHLPRAHLGRPADRQVRRLGPRPMRGRPPAPGGRAAVTAFIEAAPSAASSCAADPNGG